MPFHQASRLARAHLAQSRRAEQADRKKRVASSLHWPEQQAVLPRKQARLKVEAQADRMFSAPGDLMVDWVRVVHQTALDEARAARQQVARQELSPRFHCRCPAW